MKPKLSIQKDRKRYSWDAQTWSIRVDGIDVGTIQERERRVNQYFWYAFGRNTITELGSATSLEGCKAEVKDAFKKELSQIEEDLRKVGIE